MAGARCVGRQLSSSRPNSDWGGSQSLLGTGKGLFLQLMAAAWTARARGRRSAGLGAGPLGQADRWPVAQPESNLGSVGMVGFRPWNFGGLRKQESLPPPRALTRARRRDPLAERPRRRRRRMPQKEHPQKEQPPARPDARLRFSGPPRDKVRRESQSAHTPERIAVRGDRTHPIRPRTTSL